MHRKVGQPFWVQLKSLEAPLLTPGATAKGLEDVRGWFREISGLISHTLEDMQDKEPHGDVNLMHALQQVMKMVDQMADGVQVTRA